MRLQFGDVAENLGDDREEYPFVLITGDDLDGCYPVVLVSPENDPEPILGNVPYDSVSYGFKLDDGYALALIETARANTVAEEESRK